MYFIGVIVRKLGFKSSGPRSFPDGVGGRGDMRLLYNSEIVNLLLKTSVGTGRRPNVVILECFICQCGEGGHGKMERWEGREVARCEKWDSSEVARWEVPDFIQEWGVQV